MKIRWNAIQGLAAILAATLLSQPIFADVAHVEREPSVLEKGASGRPEFDGQKFPTRTAFRFAAGDAPDKDKPATGIPASISILALKLKAGTTPEKLFAAVEKLKKAEDADKQTVASRELADVLGPEGVKAFTDETSKKFNLPELLKALTLVDTDEAFKKAKDGILERRPELLSKAIDLRIAAAIPPAPPKKPDEGGGSGKVPTPAPEPRDPQDPKDPKDGEKGPEDPGVGPGDAVGQGVGNDNGIGQGIGQDVVDPFNNNNNNNNNVNQDELDRLKAQLDQAKRDAEEARRDAENERRNAERDRELARNNKGENNNLPPTDNNQQQQFPPLAQPGGGSPPNLSRQKMEVLPVDIPKAVAFAAFVPPTAGADVVLGGDAIDRLSGGALPKPPSPGDTFDKLMQETQTLGATGLQYLQTIFSKITNQPPPPVLTTSQTGVSGARTNGELLKTPGLFNRQIGTSTAPARYNVGGALSPATARPPSTLKRTAR